MSAPQTGQKITVISKSNIKYEGALDHVDQTNNTLTLRNVRLIGTEDRPAPQPVPPSDKNYEYIVFKGEDIQHLDVQENTPPQDPAIVRMSGPVSGGMPGMPQPRFEAAPPAFHAPLSQPSHNWGGGGGGGGDFYDRPRGGRDYRDNYRNNYRDRDGGHMMHGKGGPRRGQKGGYGGGNQGGGGGGGKGGHRDMNRGVEGKGNRRRGKKNNFASHTGLEFATAGDGKEMEEFDFDAMQKRVDEFEKEKSKDIGPAYKKDAGFFDSLGKGDKDQPPPRTSDKDTFGTDNRGGNRGNRGRGRGGR